jgi:hypothetical protein
MISSGRAGSGVRVRVTVYLPRILELLLKNFPPSNDSVASSFDIVVQLIIRIPSISLWIICEAIVVPRARSR